MVHKRALLYIYGGRKEGNTLVDPQAVPSRLGTQSDYVVCAQQPIPGLIILGGLVYSRVMSIKTGLYVESD